MKLETRRRVLRGELLIIFVGEDWKFQVLFKSVEEEEETQNPKSPKSSPKLKKDPNRLV